MYTNLSLSNEGPRQIQTENKSDLFSNRFAFIFKFFSVVTILAFITVSALPSSRGTKSRSNSMNEYSDFIGVDDDNQFNLTGIHTLSSSRQCNYLSDRSDLDHAGVTQDILSFCSKHFRRHADNVYVNYKGYSYQMCLKPGRAIFSHPTPKSENKIVVSDSFTNSLDTVVSHSFDLEGSQSQSISVSTTNEVSISVSVGYEIKLPEVLSTSFSISSSFSSSKTLTHSDESEATYKSSTTVEIPPGCTYKADIRAKLSEYRSDFKVPICLEGYAMCSFGKKVKNPSYPNAGKHYYWFLPIHSIGIERDRLCWEQNGGLASSISIDSQTSITKSGANCS